MKKILGVLLLSVILVVMGKTNVQAAEGITMPIVNSNISYADVEGVLESNPYGTDVLVGDNYNGAKIIDMLTGSVVRSFENSSYVNSIIFDDSGMYYAYVDADSDWYYYKIMLEDQFNQTILKDVQGKTLGFFNNSSKFLIKGKVVGKKSDDDDEDYEWNPDLTSLIGYDAATKEKLFERNLPAYEKIIVGNEIAIKNGQVVTIYDQNGALQDILEFDSTITDIAYTADATKLLVTTKSGTLQIFNTATYTEEVKKAFIGTAGAFDITIDRTNHYVAFVNKEGYFRLYDLTNGKRIYTERDDLYLNEYGRIALAKDAKYILIDSNVYSGKNLTKYTSSIHLESKYTTLELGESYKPTILANKADGTKEVIGKNVQWLSDNTNIAYTDTSRNLLVARNPGEFTLRANYLDMSIQSKVTVKDTKKPVFSGVKNISTYSHKGVKALKGITAHDVGEGNVTSKIKVSGNYNANKAGKYKLTYTVSDSSGNKATASRTIEVKYNPSLNMLKTSDDIYLPKSLYNKSGYAKGKQTISVYDYVGWDKVHVKLAVELKAKNDMALKKLKLTANGKSMVANITGSQYNYSRNEVFVYKELTSSQLNWIKKNVNPKKKLKVEIISNKKKITKTLTTTQKQALLDGALMYDYLKANK